jgi:dihydrofolate synthase / folylpolyglutamate synthase
MKAKPTFQETERFLHSLVLSKPKPHYVASSSQSKDPVFGLERLRELLNRLGRPDAELDFIHITGTSGKTSTATLTAALLHAHKLNVGLHISPHLLSPCERLTINNQPCEEKELIDLVQQTKPILNQMITETKFGPPSYFELMLALALKHFFNKKVDIVVLEAGLGGTFDGTNIIEESLVSLITTIGLDHTNVLGKTRQEIAKDKLGIVREKGILLTAEQDPAILSLFEDHTNSKNAELRQLFRDFSITQDQNKLLHFSSIDTDISDFQLKSPGAFQQRNAALALEACRLALLIRKESLSSQRIKNCLEHLQVSGRFEIDTWDPPIILDGAHNPEKMENIVGEVEALFPGIKFKIIYAATSGRNLEAILGSLSRIAHSFYLTSPMAEFRINEDPRHLSIQLDARAPACPRSLYLDPKDAYRAVMDEGIEGSGLLITGSLYLVSYLYEIVRGSNDG